MYGLCLEVDRSRLSLLGFSGGDAVALCVASQDKRVASIAACACPAEFTFFTDGGEAQSIIDHFRRMGLIRDKAFPASAAEWLNGFRELSPIKYVDRIAPRPLLLVHGSRDKVVVMAHAHRLYAKAGEPREIIIVEGAEHRLRQDDRAMEAVINWLKSRLTCTKQKGYN
ncbi:alpha/beta hydrolase [Chloroflexota bacterium]